MEPGKASSLSLLKKRMGGGGGGGSRGGGSRGGGSGSGPPAGARRPVPPLHGHGASHEAADAYMERFEEGLNALGLDGPPPADHPAPRAALGGGAGAGAGGRAPARAAAPARGVPRVAGLGAARAGVGVRGSAAPTAAEDPALGVFAPPREALLPGWRNGPEDPEGRRVELFPDRRPNVCMSVLGNEAVVGSTDHALYGVNITSGRRQRTLYTKTQGHTEWVTTCTHLPDGRVLSGGMDSKLCLWDAKGARCFDLAGHSGSISEVEVGGGGGMGLSASYDKTVRIWSLRGRGAARGCLQGHKAPVLALCWGGGAQAVTGDRGGAVYLWDLATEGASRPFHAAHDGHVTSLAWAPWGGGGEEAGGPGVFLSGGQDGRVCAWDPREKSCVASAEPHSGPRGVGAVSEIRLCPEGGGGAGPGLAVTAGADSAVKVLDPRTGYGTLYELGGHADFIYSLHVAGGLALSGDGAGILTVHDVASGALLYGLGANEAAVRCVHATSRHLVATGDDGCVLIYDLAG